NPGPHNDQLYDADILTRNESESFDDGDVNHQNHSEVQAEEIVEVEDNLDALDRMKASTSTGHRSKAPHRKSARVALAKIRISAAADSNHQIDRSTDHSKGNIASKTHSSSGKRTANDQHGAGPSKMPKK